MRSVCIGLHQNNYITTKQVFTSRAFNKTQEGERLTWQSRSLNPWREELLNRWPLGFAPFSTTRLCYRNINAVFLQNCTAVAQANCSVDIIHDMCKVKHSPSSKPFVHHFHIYKFKIISDGTVNIGSVTGEIVDNLQRRVTTKAFRCARQYHSLWPLFAHSSHVDQKLCHSSKNSGSGIRAKHQSS